MRGPGDSGRPRMEASNLLFVEQPVEGLARWPGRARGRDAAHGRRERVVAQDIVEIADAGAADLISLYATKPGGLRGAARRRRSRSSSITSIRMRPSPLDLFLLSVGGAPAFAYGAVGPSPVPPYGRRASAARSVRFEADAGGMVVERLSVDRHDHDVREVRIHGQAALGAREPLVSHRYRYRHLRGSLDSPS